MTRVHNHGFPTIEGQLNPVLFLAKIRQSTNGSIEDWNLVDDKAPSATEESRIQMIALSEEETSPLEMVLHSYT